MKAAGSASSLNSEILRRLQGSFNIGEALETARKEAWQTVEALEALEKYQIEHSREMEELLKRIEEIEAHMPQKERGESER